MITFYLELYENVLHGLISMHHTSIYCILGDLYLYFEFQKSANVRREPRFSKVNSLIVLKSATHSVLKMEVHFSCVFLVHHRFPIKCQFNKVAKGIY